jgi:transcriptional regulator with XRE-family HTH domain
MNTTNKAKEIKDRFNSIENRKSDEEKIKHDEYILMANFLSEIERVQKERDFKRNKLAELIKTSASYLTQVFRGDKPLNFHTLAKIQRVLNIRFVVTAYPKKKLNESIHSVAIEVKSNQFINAFPSDLNIQEQPLTSLHTSGISDGSKMYMLNIKEKKIQAVNS